jgi:predicted regulator of Ras-like GTPase activity (Roadblock/LC7/MglB family)
VLPKPFYLPELGARIETALATSSNQPAAPSLAGVAHPDFATLPPAGTDDVPGDPGLSSTDRNGALGDASPGQRSAPEPLPVTAGRDRSWLDAVAAPPVPKRAPSPSVRTAAAPSPLKVKAGAAVATPAPRERIVQAISRRVLRANQEEILQVMRDLVNEAGADAVLLTSETGVLAWAGRLDEAEILSISAAVLDSRRASEAVARVLGREQVRFEQSITGGSYVLYALDIQDAVLAVTVTGSTSLGLLRHHTRSAGESIAALCSGASLSHK